MLVLIALSLCSALIGTFLVLKKMTMLANSLSHTILLGLVVTYLLFSSSHSYGLASLSIQMLLFAAFITGLITTLLTQLLTSVMKLQEDASIGLVFTTLFALGLVLVTAYTRNVHLGVEAVMGNIDALHVHDLKLIFGVALANFIVIALFFKEFKIVSFDSSLASTLGFSCNFFNYLLMVLTAATAIGAFRAVGVLLFLAFIVGLPLTGRLLSNKLMTCMWLALAIGAAASLVSVAFSRHLLSVYQAPVSTSGLVVVTIGIGYILAVIFSLLRKRFFKKLTIS